MDAMHMHYGDGSVDFVLDKSMLDTLLCYANGTASVNAMLNEAFRVLRPGGR
ncbi:unnamed protein product [Phaeothamnion confervicola]